MKKQLSLLVILVVPTIVLCLPVKKMSVLPQIQKPQSSAAVPSQDQPLPLDTQLAQAQNDLIAAQGAVINAEAAMNKAQVDYKNALENLAPGLSSLQSPIENINAYNQEHRTEEQIPDNGSEYQVAESAYAALQTQQSAFKEAKNAVDTLHNQIADITIKINTRTVTGKPLTTLEKVVLKAKQLIGSKGTSITTPKEDAKIKDIALKTGYELKSIDQKTREMTFVLPEQKAKEQTQYHVDNALKAAQKAQPLGSRK